MMNTWVDADGTWHSIAHDEKDAGQAIRRELIDRDLIGRYTPVTIELVSAGINGLNEYREVR